MATLTRGYLGAWAVEKSGAAATASSKTRQYFMGVPPNWPRKWADERGSDTSMIRVYPRSSAAGIVRRNVGRGRGKAAIAKPAGYKVRYRNHSIPRGIDEEDSRMLPFTLSLLLTVQSSEPRLDVHGD